MLPFSFLSRFFLVSFFFLSRYKKERKVKRCKNKYFVVRKRSCHAHRRCCPAAILHFGSEMVKKALEDLDEFMSGYYLD